MIVATVSAVILLASTSVDGLPLLGCLFGKNPRAACCCAERSCDAIKIARDIKILRCARDWDDRDDAARRLRSVHWACHAEVVFALAEAVTRDPKDKVRAEAAESLGKLAPSLPEAHEALTLAAKCDPRLGVRLKSRLALKSLKRRCLSECLICEPASHPPDVRVLTERVLIRPTPLPSLSDGPSETTFLRPIPDVEPPPPPPVSRERASPFSPGRPVEPPPPLEPPLNEAPSLPPPLLEPPRANDR